MLGISNGCYLTVPARHRKQPPPQLPPRPKQRSAKQSVKHALHKIPEHGDGNVPERGNCGPMGILSHSLGSAAEQWNESGNLFLESPGHRLQSVAWLSEGKMTFLQWNAPNKTRRWSVTVSYAGDGPLGVENSKYMLQETTELLAK